MYEKVPQDDEDLETTPIDYHQPRERLRTAILSANLVLFIIVLVFYVVTIARRLQDSSAITITSEISQPRKDYPEECGETVEEAIAKNCPLDVMSNLWTPQRCYNSTFAQEALQGGDIENDSGGVGAPEFGLGTYQWFEDEALSQPISTAQELEQFLLQQNKRGLPLEAFTHMSFHAAHCSYFQRMAAAALDRLRYGEVHVWIPAVSTEPHHARHCEHVFGELFRLGEEGERRNWTKVGFGFTPCVRLG